MCLIQKDISLLPYNTFGIDATAKFLAKFDTIDTLTSILQEAKNETLLPLGGGSNILFTQNVDGLVLKNEIKYINCVKEDADFVYIQAGAGVVWHELVLYCIQNGYAGIENMSLIPGSVGASPMQNIGAYGVEIKDVFASLEAFHIQDQRIDTFQLEDCEFGYRESVFKRKLKGQYIISSVRYKLRKKPIFHTNYGAIEQELENMGISELSIKAISDAVIAIRSSKLPNPKELGNAGSFFKNPIIKTTDFLQLKEKFPTIPGYPAIDGETKTAAGWLIEQAGLKGYRQGNVGVHSKQALVLVNYGEATGKEIYDLSTFVIATVQEKFGITLEREVNII